jgi:hypothetical protein
VNDAITWETKPVSVLREFLILLAPFAPHIAEELWEKLNIQHSTSNTQHRMKLVPFGSVFGVRCSMFDVCLPLGCEFGSLSVNSESSPKKL